jgi:hypothetical protein
MNLILISDLIRSEGDRYFFELVFNIPGSILKSNSDWINIYMKLDQLGNQLILSVLKYEKYYITILYFIQT